MDRLYTFMISIIYACMNREKNLMESIRSWMGVKMISEYVVVDWSSGVPLYENDEMRLWVKRRRIRLVRVDGERHFSLSRAYNLGFRSSVKNKIIFKCDSDYKNIDASWMRLLSIDKNRELTSYFMIGHYIFCQPMTGLLIINKRHFEYYNENFNGWGIDDLDLHDRVMSKYKGLEKVIFFNVRDYIYHIPHGDKERMENYSEEFRDKHESRLANLKLCGSEFSVSKYETVHREGNYTIVKRVPSIKSL